MRVQRQGEGGTLVDQPHTGMAVPVNAALVSLGQAEPAFQAQIVLRQLGVAADKRTGPEADHHFGHLLVDRVCLRCESVLQFVELLLPPNRGTAFGSQRVGDGLDFGDVPAHGFLRVTNHGQPTFDTAG